MHPKQAVIDHLIRRIVGAVHPLHIILFGSAACGDMRLDSDIDVLIVMPEGVHRRRTAPDVHEQLFGFPVPVTVLVATPEDLRQHQDNIALVYHRVVQEGKEIYALID
jgi:predicted nucleotidyltransferase